jgi:hypothetical protein
MAVRFLPRLSRISEIGAIGMSKAIARSVIQTKHAVMGMGSHLPAMLRVSRGGVHGTPYFRFKRAT